MDLDVLIKKSHKQVLESRNVEYLIASRGFVDTWGFSNLQERNNLNNYSSLTVTKLKVWMDDVRKNHLDMLKSRELKSLARALHIPNYSRLSAAELYLKITEYYEYRKSNREDHTATAIT